VEQPERQGSCLVLRIVGVLVLLLVLLVMAMALLAV
jgi:hypothetical protein